MMKSSLRSISATALLALVAGGLPAHAAGLGLGVPTAADAGMNAAGSAWGLGGGAAGKSDSRARAAAQNDASSVSSQAVADTGREAAGPAKRSQAGLQGVTLSPSEVAASVRVRGQPGLGLSVR